MSLRKRLLVKPPSGALVPSEHFGVVLYEGDGSTSHSINGGKFGAAFYGNRSNSKITNTSLSVNTGQEFSISLWVYPQKDGSYQRILQFGNHATEFVIQKRGDNNKIRLMARISATIEIDISSTVLNNNQWYHIVVTVDGSTAKLYVNNGTPTTATSFNTQNYSGLFIGCGEGDREFVEGKIDQVRIFQKTLSSSEVSTLYAETDPESLDPLSEDTTETLQVLGDSSCIATYRFENDETDLSGNYDGTGTEIQYAVGRYGQAASFNGSSSYVSTSYIIGADSTYSISCWINTSSTGNYRTIFSDAPSNGAAIHTRMQLYITNTSTFGLTMGNGSSYWVDESVSASSYLDGNWHNIILTYSGTTIKLYANGSLVNTYTSTVSAGTANTQSVVFGRAGLNSVNYWLGKIDQVRIFNKVLSASEVTTLYNENSLVASYRFEGNANDDTRNYDGTASNVTYEYGLGFTPDFVWLKERSGVDSNRVFDTTRGATKRIYTDNTGAESAASDSLTAFDTGGFTVGSSAAVNQDGQDYVAWCLKANGGTTSSNTDGSITSTVQANTDAGFSIVKYTGNGTAGSTVGHNLSAAPEMIIIKNLDGTYSWVVYNSTLGATKYLHLDTTDAQQTTSLFFNDTNPSSTVFTLGTHVAVNASGNEIIAYCFHSVDGFSKIGSYTGNGDADGPIVETGFEPAFLMVKRSDSSDSWIILDNKRDLTNPRDNSLKADESSAEAIDSTNRKTDFLSNGFQLKHSHQGMNANGGTYIYMAFAADPDTEAPTVAKSFSTVTYTGNGGTQTISGLGFKPGLIWMKRRDTAQEHALVNIVSGPLKHLYSDLTSAEQTTTNGVSSFNDDGWTMGANGLMNNTSNDYVAWAWKADDNEPTINTEGSIDSIVSANANAGFSIVKCTASGNADTIGHGLSQAPEMIIYRTITTTGNWSVYHSALGNTKGLYLNLTNAETTSQFFWNNTSPTASVFTAYGSATDEHIAYCFHSVAGYSKIGSYTGTGTTNSITGLGFQPDFLMVKASSHASSWYIVDSVRSTNNFLSPDLSNAEYSDAGKVSFTSDGFTLTSISYNNSGYTWIYMAFKIN